MASVSTIERLGQAVGVRGMSPARGWLEYVVERRMARALAKARTGGASVSAGSTPEARARTAVRWACAKAGVTGALSGAVTTAAVVTTAETKGLAGVVALPAAAAAVAGEMLTRAVFHVDLACELGEIFGVRIDGGDELARLLSIALRSAGGADADDLGRESVSRAALDPKSLFERAADLLVGESVLRNILPFVSIISSSLTNVVATRRIGERLRHAFRYERAMLDAFRAASGPCSACIDLLVEGVWFVFTADGTLSPEEIMCLAARLDDLDEEAKRRVLGRFTADETDWLGRLDRVPEDARDGFLRTLEVAAAIDKVLPLPEEKLLRRTAEALGRRYDPSRVSGMIERLEGSGVLA
jgi:hypothetical protein